MKLCKEMIEAMGGADSALYVRFRMLACEAYNILRKNADLILRQVCDRSLLLPDASHYGMRLTHAWDEKHTKRRLITWSFANLFCPQFVPPDGRREH